MSGVGVQIPHPLQQLRSDAQLAKKVSVSVCQHDFSSRAAGAALPGEHLCSVGVLRTGRKRGVSLQLADDKAARFPGLQVLCAESRAQVGANLKQTCFNQKLKSNSKKTLPKSQPSPQPPKPYLQTQAGKMRSMHSICLLQLRGISYPLFRGSLMFVRFCSGREQLARPPHWCRRVCFAVWLIHQARRQGGVAAPWWLLRELRGARLHGRRESRGSLAPLPAAAGPGSQVCPPSWVRGVPSLLPRNCQLLLMTAAPSMSLSPARGVPRAWFADRKPGPGILAGVTSHPSPAPAVAGPHASPLPASAGPGEWAVDQPWSSLKQTNAQYFVMAFSSPISAPICFPRTRLHTLAQRARARG